MPTEKICEKYLVKGRVCFNNGIFSRTWETVHDTFFAVDDEDARKKIKKLWPHLIEVEIFKKIN